MTAPVKKERKLQSTHRCEGKAAYTGKQCKFYAKPGMRFCGQHLKVVENQNEKVRTESVWLEHAGVDDCIPVLLHGLVWSNVAPPDVLCLMWTQLGFSNRPMTTPMTDIRWDHIRKAFPDEYSSFITETRLPQGD